MWKELKANYGLFWHPDVRCCKMVWELNLGEPVHTLLLILYKHLFLVSLFFTPLFLCLSFSFVSYFQTHTHSECNLIYHHFLVDGFTVGAQQPATRNLIFTFATRSNFGGLNVPWCSTHKMPFLRFTVGNVIGCNTLTAQHTNSCICSHPSCSWIQKFYFSFLNQTVLFNLYIFSIRII